jgi:hypothetical protein
LLNNSPTKVELFENACKKLNSSVTEEERFYALGDVAKTSFELGKIDVAKQHAEELLTMVSRYPQNWNYGNAIQDGNLVLGRIAVVDGRIDDAKEFLRKSGDGPGSPQMNSFGPNMSLARDLADVGEKNAVLAYFEQCRTFWELERGRLNQWTNEVKAGKTPNFGANLLY